MSLAERAVKGTRDKPAPKCDERPRRERRRRGMTVEEVLALPASVDLETANRAFGIGRSFGFDLARRGQYPTRLLRLGRAYRVPRSEILRALGIDEHGGV